MRQWASWSVLISTAVLVLQFYVPVVVAAAPPQVTMSQVINPLYCTVDITTDGLQLHVQLMPEMCQHSAKARQLLAETRASLHL